jgi:Fe-S cluster assembly protein SufD
MINGWYYLQNRKVGNLPEGVICGSLSEIATEHPELVEKYYGKLADVSKDAFTALNTSLAKMGFLVRPDHVVIEKPIQVINLLKAAKKALLHPKRNLFVIGKNAEAKVVFAIIPLNDNYYIANNLIECFVDDEARFGFFTYKTNIQKPPILPRYTFSRKGIQKSTPIP